MTPLKISPVAGQRYNKRMVPFQGQRPISESPQDTVRFSATSWQEKLSLVGVLSLLVVAPILHTLRKSESDKKADAAFRQTEQKLAHAVNTTNSQEQLAELKAVIGSLGGKDSRNLAQVEKALQLLAISKQPLEAKIPVYLEALQHITTGEHLPESRLNLYHSTLDGLRLLARQEHTPPETSAQLFQLVASAPMVSKIGNFNVYLEEPSPEFVAAEEALLKQINPAIMAAKTEQ